MASDLISRDMTYAVVKDYFKQKIDRGEYEVDVVDCNADLQVLLFEQPTVDAVEVVHGEWDVNFEGDNIVYCNQCYIPQDMETPYCPNCGADMREGRWKGEGMGDFSCSLCGEVVSGNHREKCPNCHAKMDGGDKA